MAAWGCTSAAQSALPLFTDEPVDASDGLERELTVGTWAIYADMPLDPASILVFPPTGTSPKVLAQPDNVSETITRPSGEFAAVAKFEVESPGLHTVAVQGRTPAQMLVGPPILDVFSVSGRAAALLVGGLFLTVAGAYLWYRRTRTSD